VQYQTCLPQVILALDTPGAFLASAEHGKKQRSQQRDNRNCDK
jgi:hypothetical protein